VVVDRADLLAEFAHTFPGWLSRGVPISWWHYRVGSQYVAHRDAREALRTYRATRAAQARPDEQKEWVETHSEFAGWRGRVNGARR
jgi:hypothetical protein